MATIELNWLKTSDPISINEYARLEGFDLRQISYGRVSDEHWKWVVGRIKSSILESLDEEWTESGFSPRAFAEVTQGLYVITLGDSVSIDYGGNPSKVLYIGRGQIRKRIGSHLENWMRYLSDSLRDISFDFWFAEVRVPGAGEAYKDVESDLIRYFWDKYGTYPLQNSRNGDIHYRGHEYSEGWNKPLRNPSNIKQGWAIRPLENNPWTMVLDQEST